MKRNSVRKGKTQRSLRSAFGFSRRRFFGNILARGGSFFRKSAGMRKCGALAQNAILLARVIYSKFTNFLAQRRDKIP